MNKTGNQYRLVINVGTKIFKDTKMYGSLWEPHLQKEARRLNQLVGVNAYVERVVGKQGGC